VKLSRISYADLNVPGWSVDSAFSDLLVTPRAGDETKSMFYRGMLHARGDGHTINIAYINTRWLLNAIKELSSETSQDRVE